MHAPSVGSPEYSPRLSALRLPLLKAKALLTEIRDQRPIRNLLSLMFYSSKITSLGYHRALLLNSKPWDPLPSLLTSFLCSKHTWFSTVGKYPSSVNWIRHVLGKKKLTLWRMMGVQELLHRFFSVMEALSCMKIIGWLGDVAEGGSKKKFHPAI